MFKSANNLMAVCMVAVFSMVAYGCSSNGNGASTERDQALADLATVTTERDMALADVTRLEGELETAQNDADGDGVQRRRDQAHGRVGNRQTMMATASTTM